MTTPGTEDANRSYRSMRLLIGAAGLALPLSVLGFGVATRMPASISITYYSSIGDVFTATLATVGTFLVAYRYGPRWWERALTLVAGLAALVITFVHCAPPGHGDFAGLAARVHIAAAAVLFVLLGLVSLLVFPLDEGERRFRALYRLLGLVTLLSIAVAGVGEAPFLPYADAFDRHGALLWCEVPAVLAFALSFLAKGEALRVARAAVAAARRRRT